MATVIVDVGAQLDIRLNASSDINFDGVSDSPTSSGIGSGNFPVLSYSFGHDTTTTTNIDVVSHGEATIGAGATVTLDFTAIEGDDDAAVGTGCKVKVFCIAIESPDDVVHLKVARADAACVPLGINPVTTGYADFYRQFLFAEPVVGSVGDKIVIINPSATTVTYAWVMVGDSTTRT